MSLSSLGSGALAMAALGWRVFPLRPGGKQPLFDNPHPRGTAERANCRARCGRVGHGCRDATTDASVISAWWSRTPSANVGLACGRLDGVPAGELSSPDVVDVDVKAGAPGLASLAKLLDATVLNGVDAVVNTPSGGLHLYFAGTRQGNSAMRGLGVDFRSLGGYVVAPPSVVEFDGQPVGYGWSKMFGMRDPVPVDWARIQEILRGPRRLPEPKPGRPPHPGSFDRLVEWLASQGEGNRNSALHWAVCRALEAGAERAVIVDLEAAGVRLGLGLDEARRTVDSATRHVLAKVRG
jgi:hypothetical protein